MATTLMRWAAPDGNWQLFKERPGRLARASCADPQHLPADRNDHHCRVAMPFVQGKLVHRQILDPGPIRFAHRRTEPSLVQRLDGMPTQFEEPRHRLHVARLQQLAAGLREPIRLPLISPQPGKPLQARAPHCSHHKRRRGTCGTTRYSNNGRSRTRRTVVSCTWRHRALHCSHSITLAVGFK